MEEKIICNKEDLVAIADATRAATGSTDTYSVSELSEAAVEIISSGGGGTVVSTDAVLYTPQTLTDAQKTQARANIGAGTSSNATTSAAGLMSAADKIKLNSLSNVSIDTTLAVSGAAADAKTTGDKFTELSAMLESVGGGVTVANNPKAIHWDGTIGDRVWVSMGESLPMALVRLYDDVPDLSAHLALGLADMIPIMVSMTMPGEGGSETQFPMVTQGGLMMAQRQEDGFVMSEGVFIVPYDGYVHETITFPKKGIYGIAYSMIANGIDTSIMHVSGVAIAGNDFSESGGGKYFETKTKTSTGSVGDTLTWNGQVGNRISVNVGAGMLVYMANCTLTLDELNALTITGEYIAQDGNAASGTAICSTFGDLSLIAFGEETGAYICYQDGYTYDGVTFPKAGIYFMKSNGAYITSLTIPNYNFVATIFEEKVYLKNEHLSVLETISGGSVHVGETLTWDGNIDGRVTTNNMPVSMPDMGINITTNMFVKISDSVPSFDVFPTEGVTVSVVSNGETQTASSVAELSDDGNVINIESAWLVVSQAGYSGEGMTFPEAGVYAMILEGTAQGTSVNAYATSLTIPNYDFIESAAAKYVVKYEHLPKALQFGEMYGYGDTIMWDGDTAGSDNVGNMVYHVSDTALTIDDFANGATFTVVSQPKDSAPVTETYNIPAEDIEVQDNGLISLEFFVISIPPSAANEMGVSAGIYFAKIDNADGNGTSIYTSSFTLPNSDKLHGKTIVKIDPKYLPDGYGSGSGSTGGTTGGGSGDGSTVTLQSLGVTATATELNYVDGVTSSIQTQLDNKAAYSHTQAASTISAGTFAGQVIANSSAQTPGTSLLRNSKLVSADTNPTVNGEICWTYA